MTDRSIQVRSQLCRSGLGLVVALLLSCSASTALGAAATGFYSLPPCRIADTRGASAGSLGRPSVAALSTRSFGVRRLCGLPDNAVAVSLNVTVTGPNGSGDLRLFPGGTTAPGSSVINYAPGQTRANNSIIPIGADGSIAVQSDQLAGVVDLILDVNGYFVVSPDVLTPPGLSVKIRPATEVELTFDNVSSPAGTTAVQVLEFADNRTGEIPSQSLKAFFPNGSPEQALVPDILVPDYVVGLGKGGPTGQPTFLLALIDTKNLAFSRTAEFHGLEDFRLGWDPPCVVLTDPTQEPRTFFGRDATEPSLVEEAGGPVFVDISSGCGSNKGSGWNFSAYLTGRDTRTPDVIASYMVARMQDVLTVQAALITNPTVANNLMTDVQAAITNLGQATSAGYTSALANMADFIGIVDANPGAFNNTARNISGELVGRAQAATYMIRKLVPTGTFAEFPVPTAGPGRIALGPDGNFWFGEYNGNKIGRITRAGVVTEFTVPSPASQPYGIAAGPDGNVWFTEGATDKIGRIAPAGVITEFTVPSGNRRTLGITTGPDGNLWFTELGGGIGRVTPAGVITEFPAPGGPYGIVTGPDGNLWFTEYGAGTKVGIMTTAGVVIKEFVVSVTSVNPYGIAVGPDGNVWFAENTGNKIARITVAGVITEFPIPSPGSGPTWLTAAPDGNIWFVEDSGGRIGRITTTGVITEFPIPTPASTPYDIVRGPDGNLWFTEGAGSKIGRITP